MANYILNRTAEQISGILDGAYSANGILKSNGSGTITAQAVDSTPTASSTNLITSGAVASALNGKQNTLSNASLLATYTQTETNLADAVTLKHSHSNKAILDTIPSTGTTGYVLKKTSSGTAWQAESGGGGGGSATWGSIGGTLSDQTDLQTALNAKQDTISDLATIRSNATDGETAYTRSTNKVLYLTTVTVSATTGDIVSVSNASITADHVLADIHFADPNYITTDFTWSTSSGSLTINGKCSTATTADILLIKKDN